MSPRAGAYRYRIRCKARAWKLVCRLIGHRWTIKGLTGRYEWCHRCAARRELINVR